MKKAFFTIFCLCPLFLLAQVEVGFISDKTGNGCKSYTVDTRNRYNEWSGQCADGLISGKGVLKVYSDDTLLYVYTGDSQEGRLEGQGTLSFTNGNEFTGQFKNGLMEGQGSALYADGSSYTGTFKNNLFDGEGTRVFPKGNSYVGTFKAGKYEGQGIYTTNTGKYQGEFKNNNYHGKGLMTYKNAPSKEGYFFEGKYVGPDYESFSAALKSSKNDSCTVKSLRKVNKNTSDNLGGTCNYEFYLFEVNTPEKKNDSYLVLAYQFKNQYKGLEISSNNTLSEAIETFNRMNKQSDSNSKYSESNYRLYGSEPASAIPGYFGIRTESRFEPKPLTNTCGCKRFVFE